MLEQVGNPITFYVQFIDNSTRQPLSGLSPGVSFWKFNKSTGTASQITIAPPSVPELGTTGVYYSTLPSSQVDVEGDYVAVFTTTGAAFWKSISVVCQVGRGVKLLGTQTMAELTGVPSGTPKLEEAIMLLYMALRNKTITDSSLVKMHKDNGNQFAQAAVTDTGLAFTREKLS